MAEDEVNYGSNYNTTPPSLDGEFGSGEPQWGHGVEESKPKEEAPKQTPAVSWPNEESEPDEIPKPIPPVIEPETPPELQVPAKPPEPDYQPTTEPESNTGGPLRLPKDGEGDGFDSEITGEQIGGAFYGIFAGVVIAILAVYALLAVKAGLLSSYNRQFEEDVQGPLAALSEIDKQTQLIGSQVSILEEAKSNNIAWSLTLKELQKYSYNKVAYTSFSVATDNKAQIEGEVSSYEDLAKASVALTQSKHFTEVDISNANQEADTNKIRFTLTLVVRPETTGKAASPVQPTDQPAANQTQTTESSMTISETEEPI